MRAVGQADFALELRGVIVLAQVGLFGDDHLRSLLDDLGDVQAALVQVGAHAMDFVGRQEAVFDALSQAIGVGGGRMTPLSGIVGIERDGRLLGAKIGVGVDVLVLLRGGRHAQVDGAREVVEDFLPGAKAGAMGLVDDDDVEEIGGNCSNWRLPLASSLHRD